jgi:hypothetical protein
MSVYLVMLLGARLGLLCLGKDEAHRVRDCLAQPGLLPVKSDARVDEVLSVMEPWLRQLQVVFKLDEGCTVRFK